MNSDKKRLPMQLIITAVFVFAVSTTFANEVVVNKTSALNQDNPIHSVLQAVQPHANQSLSLKVPGLTHKELNWVGQRIYQNECASNPKYLTYWGKGEEFPSFGIGHFIWYPGLQKGKFHETFPAMVKFVSQYKAAPTWLANLNPFIAPWKNKTDFYQAWSNQELQELRLWLLETQAYQAEFIAQQAKQRLTNALNVLSKKQPKTAMRYQQWLNKLLGFKEGRFAVIDYVNFKGVGSVSEQYQGQQWGLFSVLEGLSLSSLDLDRVSNQAILNAFIKSAKVRLQLRVILAPKNRNEQRWLAGWLKRLDGYRFGHL